MAKEGWLGFENGFQIFNGKHSQCIQSHRNVLIDLSLEMANENPQIVKEQQIYDTYLAMFIHLLDQDGRYGKLNLNLEDYRFDRFGTKAHILLPMNEDVRTEDIVPRKPVPLASSHFG